MLFTYGDVSRLSGKDWYPLELRSERSVEVYLRRIIRVVPGIFKAEPVELYVPLKNRDLDEFELLEGPFIWVRSDYFIGLVRLKKVWGVVGLETKGGSRLLKDTIKVGDEYIERLKKMETRIHTGWMEGIVPGAGVRILDGNFRDFCATVLRFPEQACNVQARVEVLINLGFRKIELTTGIGNLRKIEVDGSDACWVPGFLRDPDPSEIKAEAVE